MSCDVCRNFNCPGVESGVLRTMITLPLPHCYESCLYVPCYCRQQVLSSISRRKQEAFEEEGKDMNPVFVTNEDLSYEVNFTDDPLRSKFHGPGWKKFMSDYDLRYRDIITIYLDSKDLFLDFDMTLKESRGGHRPLHKPYVALDGLTSIERNYIKEAVYTHGVDLSYRQMLDMIYFVFKANDFPTIPFVHCLTVTNVEKDCLEIPDVVMKVLKLKLGYVPLKGSIRLVQFFDKIDMPGTYSMHNDGMMQVSRFSDFAHAAQLRVGSVVLLTIERRWPTLGDMKLLSLKFNCLS